MWKIYILAVLTIHYSLCQNNTRTGRTYYLRGRTKNEFRANDRVYLLNHNVSHYDNTHKRTDTIHQRRNEWNVNNYDSTYFIDDEWNFDHKTINKTELPLFIHKFYEKTPSDNKITTRILFNDNRNSSSSVIKLNLDSLKPNETIIDAEFYFFWPLESNSTLYRQSVVLRLYQFEKHIDGVLTESALSENPDVHKLFNVIYISKAQKGWQIFKIKKPIDNWLNGERNLGLLLTISSYDDNKLLSIFNDTNKGVYRSFAVVKVQHNETESNEKSQIKDEYSRTSVPSCQMKEWTVSFKSLHWDFIISPEGFIANDCTGNCVNSQSDRINHVKLLRIFNKRASCCIPVDYLPLPLMFYDKFGNVVIKSYQSMIVAECGCR